MYVLLLLLLSCRNIIQGEGREQKIVESRRRVFPLLGLPALPPPLVSQVAVFTNSSHTRLVSPLLLPLFL